MSDTYNSASTMAWPGEEETDFNFRPPAWEILGERILKNNFIFPIYLFIYYVYHIDDYFFDFQFLLFST